MVKYRPDPRGMDTAELMKWQPTLGPFRRLNFAYTKYRMIDTSLKNTGQFFFLVTIAMFPVLSFLSYYTIEKGTCKLNPAMLKHAERPFEYFEWSRDLKKIRGEWNNNFYCWSDNPDCGKDYKIKYSS
ncbi:unnamed protein product [Blepharisma stoltei]|uniref:Complex I-B15 n=1 Tax=Blepharisma stoltei TaxID=1481888 RepID=A0AAU9IG07_9CILI|nr:unnamed protein product [Blepharisma stoltei]